MLPKGSFLLHWQDDDRPIVGEGLSRTSSKAARLWQVTVQFQAGSPMKTTVRATSKAEALRFSQNRHPTATTITVIGKL